MKITDIIEPAGQRARRGAEWMDTARPGWAGTIDPQVLDVSDPHRCPGGLTWHGDAMKANRGSIEGSLYHGGWDYACHNAFPHPREVFAQVDWLKEHGFMAMPYSTKSNPDYADLTDAWRDEIAARQ